MQSSMLSKLCCVCQEMCENVQYAATLLSTTESVLTLVKDLHSYKVEICLRKSLKLIVIYSF